MPIASEVLKNKSARKTIDISDINSLKSYAETKGYDIKEKKPSLFRRTIDIISRPLYASAGAAKALIKGENVLQEAYKGITGQEKETYSDVLGEVGIQNKFVKGGLGFALDVALDPTTYFGGALIKGASKVAGKGLGIAGKAYSKVLPESAEAFTRAGTAFKEGFGSAFSIYSGRTKEVVDRAFLQLNKLAKTKENVIDDVVAKFGKNIDPDKLEQAGEFVYNNRLIERGIKKGSYSMPKDQQTKELVLAIQELGQDLAQKAGLKGDKWYFPGIDEMRLKPTSKESKVFGVGKEGYKKEFKGLIQEATRLKDPTEAFSRRFFEVARDQMNSQFMDDMIAGYGKKTLTKAEQLAGEYVPIYKKGSVLQFYKAEKGVGVTKATPLGFLKKNDASFLNNILFPEMKTIDLLAKGIGYDKFTNLFKTAVTAYFPAFHIRNYLSGMVQNYQVLGIRAFAPANIMSGLAVMKKSDKALQFAKWKGTAKELGTALDDRFRGASRYISDIGDYIDELAGNQFRVKPISNARKLGNFVEMNQKANATVTALRKGHTLEEALNLAEKAGFDYSKITQFESKVMKRLIPFYTFARKNAQLQLETLMKNPERVLNQAKLANALSVSMGSKITEEDIKGLPEWAVEGLGFKLQEGKYVSKFGLPLEEFIQRVNKPLMSSLSSLNPIIKYPLEAKIGYDFFREQKISDINKIAPATGEKLLQAREKGLVPDWLWNNLNITKYEYKRKTYYSASPTALHQLRNLPTSRIESTLEKIFDKDIDKVNKFMAFFTGGKIYDIDQEMQKYYEERDMRRDIEDYLLGRGIGKKYENYYIYKNQQ